MRRVGYAKWHMVKYAESRPLLEASVACFRETNLPEELAASLNALSLALRNQVELSAAKAALEEVVSLVRQIGDKSQEGTAMRRMAYMHLLNENDAKASLPLAQRALALHQETGNRLEETDSLNSLAQVYSALEQWEAAEHLSHQRLEISEAIGNHRGILETVSHLGLLRLQHGDCEAALEFIDEYLSRAQQLEDDELTNGLQAQKIFPLSYLGQYPIALEKSEGFAVFAAQSLGKLVQGTALLDMANAQIRLDRYVQARETLARAWEIYTQPEIPPLHRTGVLYFRAVLGWRENTEVSLHRGLEDAQEVIALLAAGERHFYYNELAHAYRVSARVQLVLDLPEMALAASQEALQIRLSHPWSVIEIEPFLFTHSLALRANGREAEADENLQKAYDRVMLVAGKTKDETLRRSWLENVQENREILVEWEARFKSHS